MKSRHLPAAERDPGSQQDWNFSQGRMKGYKVRLSDLPYSCYRY